MGLFSLQDGDVSRLTDKAAMSDLQLFLKVTLAPENTASRKLFIKELTYITVIDISRYLVHDTISSMILRLNQINVSIFI